MDTPLFLSEPDPRRPGLPLPERERWQPLRLGLVELYHYDSEEFWFRDGHLLLRGNNGTGKSKVLSLTLPFLLDAQLKPSRIEPDADAGKKMSWNLLMGTYPRRMGYAWLEFGRIADDGRAHYLTLGAGLSAVEARPQVDCWYFIIDAAADAPRINQDIWLTSGQRVVLTRDRLREALQGRGQVFDTARTYRRAVDERLFRLGSQRYDALMDTLIQLRQPQLSKKPNEIALSNALSEALPPLPTELVADVAEARAVAKEKADTASRLFEQRSTERADAVARFQRFAATGLLLAAWPDAPLPDVEGGWTIDPALTLARRTEQALSEIKHDDEAWARVQKEVAGDFMELQRALSARGHQAQAEQSDWGLIVHVLYQNRPERPDALALRLAEEITQRNELLTAKEREILENHLQAEIAAEIQRLLQAADAQRNLINRELHRRPTSTGVRYRLLWLPLSEEEGAPVGFEAARKRLLNINADLRTAQDRSVVGAMLQQRIAAERERADVSAGPGGGSLADQLARALDYRRWHQFRVERWQDGSWRKLSGPASSGERALGLTVPLFAAVASFYTQSNYTLAPRLMLLDEAFAGIDDAARAHCMGLIREFDLDFVITSEREWACYAELPGVSICQLQRKEGIDAVYVSRWSWDGRARVREADPDRRFVPQ